MFTSGISYYTCRLAIALQSDFDVSVVLMRRLIPRRFYPGRDRVGLSVNRLDYPAEIPVYNGVDWFWGPSLVGALRFIRMQRPTVIVLEWWTGAVLHTYLVFALIARLTGAQLVVEFHETQDTGEARLRGAHRYLKALGNVLISRANSFVVHSAFDATAIRNSFRIGDRSITIIPHGPYDQHDTALVDPLPSGSTKTVLFFGTIRPYKGLEFLIEAFNSLPEQVARGLHLLVVGETWEGWNAPLDLIANSPYRQSITLVNRYVEDDEVSDFFSAADVVVLPYTRSSASGPLHIAMARGLPIVLSDVGGLRESAGNYRGVTWVKPGSADDLREVLGALPERMSERFADPRSWQDTVDSYAAMLESAGAR